MVYHGASSQDNSTKVPFDDRNIQELCGFKYILTQEALAIYMQPLLMRYVNLNKIPPPPECPHANSSQILYCFVA